MKLIVFASLLITLPVQAQQVATLSVPAEAEPSGQISVERRGLCFRGRPLAECSSFFITEAEVGYQIFGGGSAGGGGGSELRGLVLGGDVGWMHNIGERDAVGFAIGGNNVYGTIGPRYRRWLSPETSLDIGLSGAWQPGRFEVVELHVAMMYGDRVGLWVNASHDIARGDPGLAVGVNVGSEPGLIAYGAGAVTTIVIFYLFAANAD